MKELRSYTTWNFKTRALKGERAMKDLGNEFDTCMVRGMCETVACSNRSRSHFVHNFISTRVKKGPRNQHKTPEKKLAKITRFLLFIFFDKGEYLV